MPGMSPEADLWERGSRDDRLRNEFVIPAIVRLLEFKCPPRLLDVGAGTGYVARTVDSLLSFRARWTLIDTNRERMELAERLRPEGMAAETVVGDVFAWPAEGRKFDAIILSFTLLEITGVERLLEIFKERLAEGGLLLVVLPDAWADVLRRSRVDPNVIERFLSDSVDVPKVDKFTKSQYPFHAMRTESLIEAATESGFDLYSLRHGVIGSAAAYVLGFRHRSSAL